MVENPFSVSPSPRFFFLSNHHMGILAKIYYVVNHRQGLAVIYGDPGVGKTTVSRVILDNLAEKNHCIYITNPFWTSEMHMVKSICSEFGIAPRISLFAQMAELQACLIKMYQEGKSPVLLIDEAQFMRGRQFEVLRHFSNFETDDVKLLQIILCGQLELRNKLRMKKALMSRIIVTATLEALPLDETIEMILFRLQVARGNGDIFTVEALERVYELSMGIPRDAIKLCGLALELAHLNRQKQITADLIALTKQEAAA